MSFITQLEADFTSAEGVAKGWMDSLGNEMKTVAAVLWNDIKAGENVVVSSLYASAHAALPAYLDQLKQSAVALAKEALARFGQDMVGHWSFGWVLSEISLLLKTAGSQFVISGVALSKTTLESIVQSATTSLTAGLSS